MRKFPVAKQLKRTLNKEFILKGKEERKDLKTNFKKSLMDIGQKIFCHLLKIHIF